MSTVALSNVFKIYPGEKGADITAVRDFNIEITDREFVVFVGPSGCGKSTTLRMIAGLEEISRGDISIGGRRVNDVPPKDRDIAMVFQNYALYPHMSVYENMAFGLKLRKFPKAEIRKRVDDAAGILGLEQLLDRKPKALSGGQRQRVALARAIVREPKCFLMDEPLSNLDATLRAQTRADIVTLQQQLGTTTIYVTHDQVEAMTMGHRIAVMNQGVLQQVDTPSALYEQPANAFVAGFIGNPGMNLLPGTSKQGAVTVGNQPVAGAASSVEGAVLVGVRAEDLVLSSTGVQATCGAIEVLGSEVHVLADLDGGERVIIRQAADRPRPTLGEAITLELTASAPLLFDAATGQRCDR